MNYKDGGYIVFTGEMVRLAEEAFRLAPIVRRSAPQWWGSKHTVNPHLYAQVYLDIVQSFIVQKFTKETVGRGYLTHSKISLKEPFEETSWLPHQDSGYKDRPTEGFTCAVFLEDCDEENGTLWIYPGSHQFGRLPHSRTLDNQARCKIPRDGIGLPLLAISINGKCGDVLFFSLDMIHSSGINRNPNSKRLIFIFEIEKFHGWERPEHGGKPVVIGSPLRWYENLVGYLLYLPKPLIAKIRRHL